VALSSNDSFPTTRWTLIVSAGSVPSSERDAALLELCRGYWTPVHAFICRCGYKEDAAKDLTQDFFLHLLEKSLLRDATPERGRFRSYLLASLKNFLANQWDRRQALKRGGNCTLVPLDSDRADTLYTHHARTGETPETAFDRQYALTVIERAIGNLKADMARDGKEPLFRLLQPYLVDHASAPPYAELAEQSGTTEGALRVALHRLRRRCSESIRLEVAHLVSNPSEVDGELRYLLKSLSFQAS
jgi:RNA polymerase sigma factor (sigma-70 family)